MDKAPSSAKWFRLAGLIAILAALTGVVADTCLLYSAEGGYETGDFAFMGDISWSRLQWGHYLGILVIPFEALGILLVYRGLQPAGHKIALGALFLGIWIMFPGVAFHGACYALRIPADMGGGAGTELMEILKTFVNPLGAVFAVGFFVLIAVFAVKVWQGKSLFPRQVLLFSPLLTYPLWILSYFAFPPLGNFLLPAGFNLSMAIFFAAMILLPEKDPQ